MAASRIDELRRRVQSDPASIAFAQLAEEYRRSGQTEEAVRVCREGLTRHPGYLSARVTLGRALLDLGQLLGAREELEFVVAEAPENLAAVRGLAEISHREGQIAEALTYYQRALALARHDPEIEEIVQQLSRQLGAAAASPNGGLSFEEAHQELLSAAERLPVTPPQAASLHEREADLGSTAPFDFDRLVAAMGSPAAPPNVDAAIDGRASTVSLDLPEPAAVGPDPFAALEAELRAHDAAPGGAKVAPWESLYAGQPDETDEAGAVDGGDERAAAVTPADVTSDTAADIGLPEMFDEPRHPEVEPELLPVEAPRVAADSVADDFQAAMADLATPDDAPAAAVAQAGAEPPTPVPAQEPAQEGVLDELENWLTTLQDRPSQ